MPTLERATFDKNTPNVVLREHLLRYVYALKFAQDANVLDVACGTGYGSLLLEKIAKSVVGLDNSQIAIDVANHNGEYESDEGNWEFELRNLEKDENLFSEYYKEKYNLVTCFETIEHLSNPDFLVENIKKHLATHGVVIFSTPYVKEPEKGDDNEWHKTSFDVQKFVDFIDKHFPEETTKKTLHYQDQWGMSETEWKPYLMVTVET